MIIYLLNSFDLSFPGSGLFNYLTFRAGCSIITSFLIVLLIGPKFVRFMKLKQKEGQPIRADGPPSHLISKRGTPSMGGILILVALVLSTILWVDIFNNYIWIVLISVLGFGLIGFVDDYKKIIEQSSSGISWRKKIFFQILLSLIILYLFSVTLPENIRFSIFSPFINGPILSGFLIFYIFSSCVLIGSSNSVNLTDGLDGLAIVPVMIAAASFALIAYLSGNIIFSQYLGIIHIPNTGELAILCCALLGSGLGFLWFNAPPAMIFMGDTGSLSLGALLGSVSIATKHELVLFIIGGLFVFEALSVIVQVISFRLFGRRVFMMAPLHHHFEQKGWSEPTIVIRFWIIAFILALIGLSTLKLR